VPFEERVRNASQTNKSRIVLALDLEDSNPERLAGRSKEVLEKASPFICAVKLNRQLVLSLGLRKGVDSILQLAHDLSLPTIMDAKLNDVGHTNEFIARTYFDVGFDAIIASPVVGWNDGLEPVFRVANAKEKAVILLVYMSNPGSEMFYSLKAAQGQEPARPVFEQLTELALQWKANGAIVGATKPEIIKRVRQLVSDELRIYSPGVGTQGGDLKKALEAGADYLIVGRSIYQAANPAKAAEQLRNEAGHIL
jgi:orotidine-5'-phosphate decarboxylase